MTHAGRVVRQVGLGLCLRRVMATSSEARPAEKSGGVGREECSSLRSTPTEVVSDRPPQNLCAILKAAP